MADFLAYRHDSAAAQCPEEREAAHSMSRAFLAYSRDDRRWVSLVKRLLDFHHVATWLDTDDIEPGRNYVEALQEAIGSAEVLLIVVGKGAASSTWLTREIATYKALSPDGPVVPLLFDEVPLNDVFDGLDMFQHISFVDDLDAGFSTLFKYLDADYLAEQDRRTATEDRRASDERRSGDRRRAGVEQRLRLGLWKEFHSKIRFGQYDEFGGTGPEITASTVASNRLNFRRSRPIELCEIPDVPGAILRYAAVLAAPESELSRYEFRDKDSAEVVEFDVDMLREVLHRAYRHQENIGGRTANIYVVEQVAFSLAECFDIKPKDRREDDRRSHDDRRTKP